MGSQINKEAFIWPTKGDVPVWTIVYEVLFLSLILLKQKSWSDESSKIIIPELYTLSWNLRSKILEFVAIKKSDNSITRFKVDYITGKYIQSSPTLGLLSPQMMWRSWVQDWMGQPKTNEITFNTADEIKELFITNPKTRISRQRQNQIQTVYRETRAQRTQKSKYALNEQYYRLQLWIFDWNKQLLEVNTLKQIQSADIYNDLFKN
ncbi:hypothetical protein pb186bvf_018689 [Paramecium bursaria]